MSGRARGAGDRADGRCTWCFFLHITTGGARQTPTHVLALAFGILIVLSGDGRIALDHGEPQPQHDADGSDHADAALAEAICEADRAPMRKASAPKKLRILFRFD